MHLISLFLLFLFLNVQANNVQLDLRNVHAHAGNIEHELDLKSAHAGKVHDEVKVKSLPEDEKFHEQNLDLEQCNCKHHYKYDMTEEDVYSDDGKSTYELDVLRDDPLGEGTFGMVRENFNTFYKISCAGFSRFSRGIERHGRERGAPVCGNEGDQASE